MHVCPKSPSPTPKRRHVHFTSLPVSSASKIGRRSTPYPPVCRVNGSRAARQEPKRCATPGRRKRCAFQMSPHGTQATISNQAALPPRGRALTSKDKIRRSPSRSPGVSNSFLPIVRACFLIWLRTPCFFVVRTLHCCAPADHGLHICMPLPIARPVGEWLPPVGAVKWCFDYFLAGFEVWGTDARGFPSVVTTRLHFVVCGGIGK